MTGIDEALAAAAANFRAKHPRAEAQQARASAVMPGGNTRTVLFTAPFPIRAVGGEGAHLSDCDGHRYLDLLGEYSAGIYGHSHPRIRAAVNEALDTGLNLGAHNAREVDFAEAVTRRFGLDLVRFTNSGTEANMMALAAARCFTGRGGIMPMLGGYHGGTLYFSAGASPVNAPFEAVLGRFNDIAATRALIAQHAEDLAAVIVEPMLGGGGCLPAEREFLAMLREETARAGIVLIFDEVMTSRLHPGGLAAHYGITPDLVTLGKYVGGGMSFGAFGGKRAIMAQFDPAGANPLPHAGTFNNNTLTMAAGLAGLTEVYTPEACLALNARGDILRERLNELFMRSQVRLKATGMGSMLCLHPIAGELRRPEEAQQADKRLRQLMFLDLLERGIYIAERGFMALSLPVSEADCDRLVTAIEDIIATRRPLLI
jgi:glutamate-1-semialdehyde 2,1-aminomutase